MRTALTREEVIKRLDVSHETVQKLDAYVALLSKWQLRINLVASSSLEDVWFRHIFDCGQLLTYAPQVLSQWVDLGSGAGLPGLVIALLLKDRHSDASVTLVESNRKKCAFLLEAIRVTAAPANVIDARIESAIAQINRSRFQIITARALASMPTLLTLASPLLTAGAIGLFLKGRDAEAELTEAAKYWKMDVELYPSLTDPGGRIVCVRALASRTSRDGHLA